MKNRLLGLSMIAILVMALQGCIVVDRDGSEQTIQGTTIGQELQDLSAAYDEGLLSEQEYNRLRRQLLER